MKPHYLSALLMSLFFATTVFAEQSQQSSNKLPKQFAEKHEQLIPVVAVADMFFACNRDKKTSDYDYRVEELVNDMDRNKLADNLMSCLGNSDMKSDVALNYGLVGCFHEQMKGYNQQQYDEKMASLHTLLKKLPREERQKTFTRCVTEQAIYYIK